MPLAGIGAQKMVLDSGSKAQDIGGFPKPWALSDPRYVCAVFCLWTRGCSYEEVAVFPGLANYGCSRHPPVLSKRPGVVRTWMRAISACSFEHQMPVAWVHVRIKLHVQIVAMLLCRFGLTA